MALATDYDIATQNDFIQKVQMSLISTALAVQSESVGTANHAQRSAYALRVLADPSGFARLMAPGFTVDGSANNSTTDAALESRASAIWNAYAVQS